MRGVPVIEIKVPQILGYVTIVYYKEGHLIKEIRNDERNRNGTRSGLLDLDRRVQVGGGLVSPSQG